MNGMSNKGKEMLGERVSRLRTGARGAITAEGPKQRVYLKGGGYTVPDQRALRAGLPAEIVESKAGLHARLSKRQRQAHAEGLPGYRVDHVLPSDVGVAIGLPAASYGYTGLLDYQPPSHAWPVSQPRNPGRVR
jgi:hypothetical protein